MQTTDGGDSSHRTDPLEGDAMNADRPPPATIRVLIVDDHPMLREGLAAVLRIEPDISVVAVAGDGAEAIDQFRTHRPDVTLMDAQMPKLDGIAAIKAIRAEWPDARVVMLTTYAGDALALRALKAGASGYLLKSMARMHVLTAIRSVHAGQRYIPPEVAAAMATHLAEDSLTPRELEVLRGLAAGGSNRAIAARFFVSEDTIKSHVKSILAKLAANDRTQAVVIALKRGIIDV